MIFRDIGYCFGFVVSGICFFDRINFICLLKLFYRSFVVRKIYSIFLNNGIMMILKKNFYLFVYERIRKMFINVCKKIDLVIIFNMFLIMFFLNVKKCLKYWVYDNLLKMKGV